MYVACNGNLSPPPHNGYGDFDPKNWQHVESFHMSRPAEKKHYEPVNAAGVQLYLHKMSPKVCQPLRQEYVKRCVCVRKWENTLYKENLAENWVYLKAKIKLTLTTTPGGGGSARCGRRRGGCCCCWGRSCYRCCRRGIGRCAAIAKDGWAGYIALRL